MPRYYSLSDGAQLFYGYLTPATKPPAFSPRKGSKTSQRLTLVFLHQWPLSSRMYDPLLLTLCETYRFRCIALDRRGHGQSDWSGPDKSGDIDYNVLSRDVVGLLEHVNPGPFIFVAASMGTGETLLAHTNSDYVRKYCKVSSPEAPTATPREVWDMILDSLRYNRSQFVSENFKGPLGVGSSNTVSDKDIELFERIFDAADALAVERCAQMFTSEDFTQRLAEFGRDKNVPLLLIHGGIDDGVPLAASAERVQQLVPGSRLIVYEDGGHVLVLSHIKKLLTDIIDFAALCST
ncbi:Alpha/Beta hydrolase protein [Fusarium oxysporum Fo47]|uniref:Alpha/Beta hydrolase protein n=1 Tax=Fusarium oxysporum Fo47 TaxID=660027 RepID=UPI002869B432|nr:Alpha/Beta hydrolase protein [Fusarium oxysporum Fo47]QKD56719.2 Alpha/Beta hydrolase protein [Fusarium oxysporum Fo47]